MSSLEVLSDTTITALSPLRTRQSFIQDIDLALKEVESAYSILLAARLSPVRQALNLLRRKSNAKLETVTPVLEDEHASAVSLAADVVSGKRPLASLPLVQILLLRRALRTRRNSLAPISRLPTEILSSILQLCPTIDADEPDYKTGKFVLGLTVSHVCRRWRDIAMKHSRFWSNIVLSRPRWALEMIHRSRAAGLVVAVDFESSVTKAVAARDLVLAQLSRIRELHLIMPGLATIPSALLLAAPMLNTFHLWYKGPQAIFVTAKLFQGCEVPTLRHLSLRYCLLEGTSPLWENLVSLELIHAPIDLAMDAFLLVVLTRMPYLRALTLNESFPETLEASEPVALALETLHLTSNSWRCSSFLRALSIPKCQIVLNVPYSSSDVRFVWDALESHRMESADPVLYSLKIADLPPTPDGASQFDISFSNQPPRTGPSAPPRYTVRLAVGPPALPHWREEIMYNLLTIVSLEQLTTLTVTCAALKISTSLLHLQHFRSAAFHAHVEPFTDTLEGDPLMAASDRFHQGDVHYPRLRKIAFRGIVFGERHMEVILDWLAQRKRLGLAIEEIWLVGCTLTPADMGGLRELVGRVRSVDE
ncbi:hypothetical protein DFH06DRAFT_1053686 [Mycena polygramma]|nr:hypothetical protein DFH06DRAFT_1053686 [Mycena polygramma]